MKGTGKWLMLKLAKDPESLLALLVAAHKLDRERHDVYATFHAGVLVGAANPECARALDPEELKRALLLLLPPAPKLQFRVRVSEAVRARKSSRALR